MSINWTIKQRCVVGRKSLHLNFKFCGFLPVPSPFHLRISWENLIDKTASVVFERLLRHCSRKPSMFRWRQWLTSKNASKHWFSRTRRQMSRIVCCLTTLSHSWSGSLVSSTCRVVTLCSLVTRVSASDHWLTWPQSWPDVTPFTCCLAGKACFLTSLDAACSRSTVVQIKWRTLWRLRYCY